MGYRVVETETVDPRPDRPCELRALSAPAGLEQLSANRYVAEPGEQIPLAYHYHDTQEEFFYVLAGTMHVETPEATYEVPADAVFAVDPGSPHRAYNPADAEEPVAVLAVGAPPADDGHKYEPEEP